MIASATEEAARSVLCSELSFSSNSASVLCTCARDESPNNTHTHTRKKKKEHEEEETKLRAKAYKKAQAGLLLRRNLDGDERRLQLDAVLLHVHVRNLSHFRETMVEKQRARGPCEAAGGGWQRRGARRESGRRWQSSAAGSARTISASAPLPRAVLPERAPVAAA